ncbi:MAG TPA: type II secretion system secretin GspD [Azospirillum sp.]|nr:type II secretion system secretin GspD [Azospirillum sp.]
MSAALAAAVLLSAGCQRTERGDQRPMLAQTVGDLGLNVAGAPALSPPQPQARPGPTVRPPANPIIVRGSDRPPAPAPRPASGGPATIELNFADTSLPAVVRAVLGDILNVPYALDPRVQGTVSLSGGRPLTRDEALATLETALRMNGAALVRDGTLHRVVPAAEARPGGQPVPPGAPGVGVSLYAPRHTSADTLKRLLEPLYGVPGALQVLPEGNLLAITGGSADRTTLTEAAEAFDQDWLAGQSVGIFPLNRAGPKALIDELEVILNSNEPNAGPGLYRLMPIDRLNAVMVVTRRSRLLDQVAGWVRALDQGGDGERSIYVHNVQHARARDLARVLGRVFGQGGAGDAAGGAGAGSLLPPGTRGVQVGTESMAVAPVTGGAADTAPASRPGGGGMGTGAVVTGRAVAPGGASARGASPDAGVDDSGNGGGGGTRIVADDTNNALVIMATPAEYRLIESAINRLDVPAAQVLIEATIAEVTLNDALRFGVQYFLKGNGILGSNGSLAALTNNLNTLVPQPELPGLNLIAGTVGDPRVVLNALDAVTKVRVVSSPQVVVRDNQTAMLKVGDQVPVLTQRLISTQASTPPIVNSVDYRDTGVILTVTPRINAGGNVAMEVAQEVSNVARTSSEDPLTPTISQRRIESSVTVPNAQTVVLGGLISDDGSEGRSGIPVLAEIPVLGNLFSTTDNRSTRRELIVFITPRVVRNGDDARRLTQELMGRLRSMNTPPPKPIP